MVDERQARNGPDDAEELIPPSFDQHTVVLLVRSHDAPELDEPDLERLQREHLAYLRDLGRAGVLMANGPLTEQSDERLRGLSVYALPPDEARRAAEADPMVRAGRLAVEMAVWWTAEGAVAFGERAWPHG